MESKLGNLKIEYITVGERFRKDYQDLNSLKASITTKMEDGSTRGLIHPIAVMSTRSTNEYFLLAGGRRFAAYNELAKEDERFLVIPCKIFPHINNEYDRRMIEESENLHREGLTYPEQVALTKRIHDLYVEKFGEKAGSSPIGHSARDTAKMLNVSHGTVAADLELAEAIEEYPELGMLKNKKEAQKVLGKVKEGILLDELSRRAEIAISSGQLDSTIAQLCDSYVVGDFFERCKDIPDGWANLIEIDPPYGINLVDKKKVEGETTTEDYNEVPMSDYYNFMAEVLTEAYRMLSPTGWVVLWYGIGDWHADMHEILADRGFKVSKIPAIWVKGGGQTLSPEMNLANSYETFWYATKKEGTIMKQGRSNLFTYRPVPPQFKIHPTERPIEMIEEVVATFTPPGGRVVVPFAGSGNTLLACANLGMKVVGWDLTKLYRDRYLVRVMERNPGEYNSYE